MPGGNVYKDHTLNKETAQYIARIFTIQVREHYKTQEIEKYRKTQKIHGKI
jgi:hypothetical protein